MNLEEGGKVTSHLVKYSHHVDGRAHFSQDGKIFTAIKRQSIALDKQYGHIFSLLIQGLTALDPAGDDLQSNTRAAIEFAMEMPGPSNSSGDGSTSMPCGSAILRPLLAQLCPVSTLMGIGRIKSSQPALTPNARHVLAISCIPIPALGPEPEIFLFYGGFPSPDIMTDPSKEAGFLAFMYPVIEPEKLRERLGSVDFINRQ